MASVCVTFWAFLFFCSLVFYILGVFLMKQLFHSRLLDMRWLYSHAPRWLSIISYPTRAHGIIVKYLTLSLVNTGERAGSYETHTVNEERKGGDNYLIIMVIDRARSHKSGFQYCPVKNKFRCRIDKVEKTLLSFLFFSKAIWNTFLRYLFSFYLSILLPLNVLYIK